jgi:hypothetical protein
MNEQSDMLNFDRVTTVLAPFSGLNMINSDILANAAKRGSLVHDAADCIIAGLPFDDEAEPFIGYINSFKSWMADKNFLDKPSRFFDEEFHLSGECDGIYEKDGEIVLFDLKTPIREGSTWALQGSAYAYLAKNRGYKIDKVEFVKLDKEGANPRIYHYEDSFHEFLSLLKIYRKYFKYHKTILTDF